MRLSPSALKKELVYPFIWIKNFFEAIPSVPFQILSLRGWRGYDGEIVGQFQENYRHNVPRTATKLREFLQVLESKELLQFVSRAAGKSIELSSMSFQNFINNDYWDANLDQDIYLTLFLSDHWQHNWGGITEFKRDETWGSRCNPNIWFSSTATTRYSMAITGNQDRTKSSGFPNFDSSSLLRKKLIKNRGNHLTLLYDDV